LLGVLALTLLAPVLALFALVTLAFAAASLGALPARGSGRPGRVFLISPVDPGRSVIRALPPASVHLIAESGERRLYSNLADRRPDVR